MLSAPTRFSTAGPGTSNTRSPRSISFSTPSVASCSDDRRRFSAGGGRLVSVAEDPPQMPPEAEIDASYIVVEPNREQLVEIAGLVDHGTLRPAIDSVFPLSDARAAFTRSLSAGKRGKVVLRVADD
ncbi:MAG TPA: zinc-binding dehydrogenase [Jiangellaceae bacterium]|nr:zinc-binding dehydrogenase [Jiangellaceae bacterium]